MAGLAGILIERIIIRPLYDRPLDTIVATWGVSMIVTQGTLILLGSTLPEQAHPSAASRWVPIPIPSTGWCSWQQPFTVLGLLWLGFTRTRFGVLARATIQVPHIAQALGVNTSLVYSLTFGLGAALAGLAGGLYAPP